MEMKMCTVKYSRPNSEESFMSCNLRSSRNFPDLIHNFTFVRATYPVKQFFTVYGLRFTGSFVFDATCALSNNDPYLLQIDLFPFGPHKCFQLFTKSISLHHLLVYYFPSSRRSLLYGFQTDQTRQ